MPWWIWSLPLLLVALVVYRLARAAPAYSHHVGLDDVDELLRSLLRPRARTPVLVLERDREPGVLQITATGPREHRTLELEVPLVDWSSPHFDDLEIALRASGHEPRRDGGSKCGEVRHTLSVSLSGATSDLARNGARLITLTARALGWPENVRITAHIERT